MAGAVAPGSGWVQPRPVRHLSRFPMKTPPVKSLLLAGALCLALAPAAALRAGPKTGWTDHEAQALAKARAEKKLVLLNFTGSDWCIWCVWMDQEVYSRPEFQNYAKDNLVLVELDYPQRKRLPLETVKQNLLLAQEYDISAYPTLVVLNSQGKVVKTFEGYQSGGAAALVRQLKTLKP